MISSGEYSPDGRAEYIGFRVITLPKEDAELRQALHGKLEEYGRRFEQRLGPDPTKTIYDKPYLELFYKQLILDRLLRYGEVNTDDMKHELGIDTSEAHERIFDGAAGVIEDYVRTGGKNLRYGTGLRKA